MKKTILSLVALLATALSVNAQTWNMVITHEDGTVETLATSAVKSVTFTQPDQNADQVIIKEIYNGGVMKDDNSGSFAMDKNIILYNNCSQVAVINNLCIGMSADYNAEASSNSKLYKDGNLIYTDFIPAINGIWYFPKALTIQPYSQVVVNICGAIDNTQTVSNSINYANEDYYCMYDPTYKGAGSSESNMYYNNTRYYPSPADVIPTSHYLKTVKYGMGNAWPMSQTSPAVFIFKTTDGTPVSYGENADNLWYAPGNEGSAAWACLKVPTDWIIDGVEVFNTQKLSDCVKRLTSDVDAGHVNLTSKLGHVVYRNVDKESTEALAENAGKLVYDYTLGTDPSGIDAEASMKAGAHIVFQDTDNSTNDFHEREKSSLR